MTESLITHLRHVDLAIPDYQRQLEFYTRVWGLTEVAADNGISFLAAEGSPERYIIRLRRDEGKRLDLVSFGAATDHDVDALAERLIKSNVAIAQDPRQLDTEGGGYGLRFFDLDGARSRSAPASRPDPTAGSNSRSRSRSASRTWCSTRPTPTAPPAGTRTCSTSGSATPSRGRRWARS